MKLLEHTIQSIEPQSQEYREAARNYIHNLTMPRWALGRILDLAVDLAGMTRQLKPSVQRKNIVLMAGDHGIWAEGVSDQPQAVTAQMVYNFVRGGGGICALAENAGAAVTVVDMGVKTTDFADLTATRRIIARKVGPGTANFARGPAMTREQAIQSLEAGIEVAQRLAPLTDVFGTGEMGIGNTSPSSAIVAVLTGIPLEQLVDAGAGLPVPKIAGKTAAIRRGIELNQPDPNDGLDILTKVGGFEIGGIAGLCLGAAALRRPVVVDGFISSAGALIAHALCPTVADYLIPAHGSVEKGHRHMMKRLDKQPLLDLNLRLGEGTGAALAMNLLDAAHAVMTRMASFDQAGVTEEGL